MNDGVHYRGLLSGDWEICRERAREGGGGGGGVRWG